MVEHHTVNVPWRTGHPAPASLKYFVLPIDLESVNQKLIADAEDCFKIISSCLGLYEYGDLHMFKALAGQLRILFCDTTRRKDNSLLERIHPDIRLLAFHPPDVQHAGHLAILTPPFLITEKPSGLQTAEIFISYPPQYVPLAEWRQQTVDFQPDLSVKDIVRSVADKGGGAHVDTHDNLELHAMKRKGPAKLGVHVLFTIALARYAQTFGQQLIEHWKNHNEKI